jgi:hypothetical protein
MNELSLLSIMREDPNMAARLAKGIAEVRESKGKILTAAEQIQLEYADEIKEGTRRKQLLIEYGKRGGKTEQEVLEGYGKFLPTVQTPILNFLHFLLRDGEQKDWLKVHKEINESLENKNQDIVNVLSTDELDRLCETLVHEDEKYFAVQEPKEMDSFIYGNLSHDLFKKIKKLKTLAAHSTNDNEATLARQLCVRLCVKFGLEYNKIPVYVNYSNE